MNQVNKMILVPHESVARLHDTTTSTPQTQMSALDTEMNYILRKQYADDSEKWKKYNETLQRFLHFSKESQKPFSFAIEPIVDQRRDESDSNTSSVIRQQLSSVLPKAYKDQALRIHDYLSVSGSPVTWDAQGIVSVKGTPVPHSNIVDLISDLTRYRKNFEPHGVSQFIQTLAHLNIPLDLVGNEKRRTAILQAKQSGGGIISPPTHPSPLPETTTTQKTKPKANRITCRAVRRPRAPAPAHFPARRRTVGRKPPFRAQNPSRGDQRSDSVQTLDFSCSPI